jgi:hypothetical protein
LPSTANCSTELGVNVNNGMANLYEKVATLPQSTREEVLKDLHACHEGRPELAMVDSAKGITNFHSPNDIIVDASMPAMNLCGLLINNPVVFILRVFDIPIRRVCAERLSGLTLGFEHGPDLAAGVLGIEFIEDIDERRHIVLGAVDAVNTVVDGDEADVGIGENHLGIHTDLQIVSAKPGHILDDDRSDKAVINHGAEPVPVRTVKIRTAVTVVHKELRVPKAIVISVLLKNGFSG